MAFGRKKTIRVEFIEARTQSMVGYDEIAVRDIPDNFEDETWVEIDGDRWKVMSVEPQKLRQARKEGALKVQVNLVEKRARPVVEEEGAEPVLAEEVKEAPIYRNPSRADQLPRMSGKRGDLQLLEIATYEWRDIEFTVANNRSTVREVFGKIEELILLNSTERDGRTFYTRQYDRYDMFAPMRGIRLPLETVITDYFPEAMGVDGLTFMGSEQVADSTFVFRVGSGIGFYGQEFDDIIRYLAVVRPTALSTNALQVDAEKIAALMKRKELIMVDWQRRQIVDADAASVYEFFLQGFTQVAVAAAQRQANPAPELMPTIPVVAAPNTEQPAVVNQNPVAPAPITEQAIVVELNPVVAAPITEQPVAVDLNPVVAAPISEQPVVVELNPVVAAPITEQPVVVNLISEIVEPIAEQPLVMPENPMIDVPLVDAPAIASNEVTELAESTPIINSGAEPAVDPSLDAQRRATYLANLQISQQIQNQVNASTQPPKNDVEEPVEPIEPEPIEPEPIEPEPIEPEPVEPEPIEPEPVEPEPVEPDEPSTPLPLEFPPLPEAPSFPNEPAPMEFPPLPAEPAFHSTPEMPSTEFPAEFPSLDFRPTQPE